MQTAIPISAIILDTVLKATFLLALTFASAFVLKKRSAATRHMVRSFALAALLLLPFSVMVLPEWPVKGLPGFAKSKIVAKQSASMAPSRMRAGTSLPATTAVAPTSPSQRPKAGAEQQQGLVSRETPRASNT